MILKAENLTLTLSGKKEMLFKEISFELNEGETGIISGRAGSGKTLLGLSLCGFLPLWVGNFKLDGQIKLFGEPLIQGRYNNDVGIILENPYTQISGLKRTVFEELAFPLECRGIQPPEMSERIERYAGILGISHLLRRDVRNLSGGEVQRIIIATALISGPRFLFLDRLMTEIDTDFRPRLLDIIASHIREFDGSVLIAEDPWLLPDQHFHKEIRIGPQEEPPDILHAVSHETSDTGKRVTDGDLLSVESLSFRYDDENPVLNDFSFSLGHGEILFLTGPNGAGKTTLAKLITGIIQPTSGEIILDGKSLIHMEQWETMSLAGLALQNPGLHLCRKTVREELALAEQWGNSPGELTEILGIDRLLECHPLELTQAEKKRLGMALAYGKERKIVILDEPSQYQDWDGFSRITDALKMITGEGKGVLIITHDPRFFQVIPDSPVIRLSQ